MRKQKELLCEFLIKEGANVNAKDSKGNNPLHIAAMNGSEKMCKLLIDAGIDINAQDNFGNTALFNAGLNGKIKNVKLLLVNGASYDITNNSNQRVIYRPKVVRNIEEPFLKKRVCYRDIKDIAKEL